MVNTFVALKECPNGKAQGITEAITLAMNEKDPNWKDKTACLGTDGATVMVGQHGGVFWDLKTRHPKPHKCPLHCPQTRTGITRHTKGYFPLPRSYRTLCKNYKIIVLRFEHAS